MAVASVRDHVETQVKAAGTTNLSFQIGTTASTAGNLLVARIVFDNLTATTPTVSSIAKPGGETASWVRIGFWDSPTAGGASGLRGEMWVIKTTVSWTANSTYTITLSGSVTAKACQGREFSGVTATLRGTAGTNATTSGNPSATTGGTAPQAGDLVLGFAGWESRTAPVQDSDTTNGTWAAGSEYGTSGGSGVTNVIGLGSYKIVTAGGHQTYNPTGPSGDSGACVVALVPVPVSAVTVTSFGGGASTQSGIKRGIVLLPQQSFTDDFVRPDAGDLGTGWLQTATSNMGITSNAVESISSTDANPDFAAFNGASGGLAQYAQVTIAALGSNGIFFGPAIFVGTHRDVPAANRSGVTVFRSGSNWAVRYQYRNAANQVFTGTQTLAVQHDTTSSAAGDVVRLQGTYIPATKTVWVWIYNNGKIAASGNVSFGSADTVTTMMGRPGIGRDGGSSGDISGARSHTWSGGTFDADVSSKFGVLGLAVAGSPKISPAWFGVGASVAAVKKVAVSASLATGGAGLVSAVKKISLENFGTARALVASGAPSVTAKKRTVVGVLGLQQFSDNFNRADGDPGSNYTQTVSSHTISGNVLTSTSNTAVLELNSRLPLDAWVQFTVVTAPGATSNVVRLSDSGTATSLGWSSGSASVGVAGAPTGLSGLISAGDVMRIEQLGTRSVRVYRNGVLNTTVNANGVMPPDKFRIELASGQSIDDLSYGVMDTARGIQGQAITGTAVKLARSVAPLTFGSYSDVAATKIAGAVSVSGLASQGIDATSAVQKVAKAAVSNIAGIQLFGIGSKLGRIVYAASAQASGLHQITAKKFSAVSGHQNAGVTQTSNIRKVGRPTVTAAAGAGSSVTLTKLAVTTARELFGLSSTSNAVHRGRVLAAAETLGAGFQQALAKKVVPNTSRLTAGNRQTANATKVAKASAVEATGVSLLGVARKVRSATATSYAALAPQGIGSKLGRIVSAANALASGLHQVAATKVSTPSVRQNLGTHTRSAATKVNIATGQLFTGDAPQSTARKSIAAAALAYFGNSHNASTTAVAQVAVNVAQFFGNIQTALVSRKSPVTAAQTTGTTGTGLSVKKNSVTATQASGAASASAIKKVGRPSAVLTHGLAGLGQITKIGTASARQIASGASSATARKIVTGAGYLTSGSAASVAAKKVSTNVGYLVSGHAPTAVLSTFRSAAATLNGAMGVATNAVAQKRAVLTTMLFGEGTFGEGTFGMTGRTRGHLGVAANVVVAHVQNVMAVSQGRLGAMASVAVKKIAKPTTVERVGVAEVGEARKVGYVSATVNEGSTASVLARKVSSAVGLLTLSLSTSGTFRKMVRWVANTDFGQFAAGLTNKKTTHTVTLDAPISENARMAKRIGITGRGITSAGDEVVAQKKALAQAQQEVGASVDVVAQKRGLATVAVSTGVDVRNTVQKRLSTALQVALVSYQEARVNKVAVAAAEASTATGVELIARKVATPIQEVATVISHFVFPLFIGITYGADYLVETTPLHTPWEFGDLTTNWTAELSVPSWDIPTDLVTSFELGDVEPGWTMTEVFNT